MPRSLPSLSPSGVLGGFRAGSSDRSTTPQCLGAVVGAAVGLAWGLAAGLIGQRVQRSPRAASWIANIAIFVGVVIVDVKVGGFNHFYNITNDIMGMARPADRAAVQLAEPTAL